MQAPDVPVCVEYSLDEADCVTLVSGKAFTVDESRPYAFDGKKKQTWWEARVATIVIPASAWVQIRGFVIKSCKQMGTCQEAVSSWDRTINIVDTQLEKKK